MAALRGTSSQQCRIESPRAGTRVVPAPDRSDRKHDRIPDHCGEFAPCRELNLPFDRESAAW